MFQLSSGRDKPMPAPAPAIATPPHKAEQLNLTPSIPQPTIVVNGRETWPVLSKKLWPLIGVGGTIAAAAEIQPNLAVGYFLLAAELAFGGLAIFMLWPRKQ